MAGSLDDGDRKRPKVVICGSYRALVTWARQQNLGPHEVVWVNRPEVLLGLELREDDVVRVPPLPADLGEIERLLVTRIR